MILALLLAGAEPNSTALTSAFRAAHLDYSAQLVDKFAEATADPTNVGARFVLIGPVKNGDIRGAPPGDAYFSYGDGKLRLIFSPHEEYASVGISGPRYMVGVIGGREKSRPGYIGTNAFGASANVKVRSFQADGLAMLERPEGEVSPYTSSISILPSVSSRLPPEPRNTYWVEFTLSGAVARKLGLDAALLVEGAIAPLTENKLNFCKPFYAGPTIYRPSEVYGQECWVGAKISRIAFIRRTTGEVLKEWVVQ